MSINQNANASALPNFRNLGILLRILVIVDGLCLAAALIETSQPLALMDKLIDVAAVVQPILIASLLLLAALAPWLRRLAFWPAIGALIALENAVTTGFYFLGQGVFANVGSLERYWLFTLLITGVLIGYFDLRGRALSPALTEARLQALQARIRPHFLFNSINAVLSVIRQNPKQAETALEDMAELFRVLMADNREMAPLESEINLCRQYLALEQLRLGERLHIEWDIAEMPRDALLPPLMVQPLLENAVYHGIEPRTEPGIIHIRIHRESDRVHIVLRNPYKAGDHHAGNRMALDNIRERLALHFDAEANIKSAVVADHYEVRIAFPYLTGGA